MILFLVICINQHMKRNIFTFSITVFDVLLDGMDYVGLINEILITNILMK